MDKTKQISSIIYEKSDEEDEEEETRYVNIRTTQNESTDHIITKGARRSFTTNIKRIKLKDYDKISKALIMIPETIQNMIFQPKRPSRHYMSSITLNQKEGVLNKLEESNNMYSSLSNSSFDSNNKSTLTTNRIDSNEGNMNVNTAESLLKDKTIDYTEVLAYFASIKIDNTKKATRVEGHSQHGWLQGLLMKCYKDYQLLPFLLSQRERLFAVAHIEYNSQNKFHKRMVNSIMNFIEHQQQHNHQPQPHQLTIEDIGLLNKSNNIINETGIFGLIQIIALIDRFPTFTQTLYTYLRKTASEWAFGLFLLNSTKIALELLKSGVLIVYCNKNRNILDTINNFYFGIIYQLNQELLSQSNNLLFVKQPLSASYITTLLSQIKNFAQKNPGHFFWNTNQMYKFYPTIIISTTNKTNTDNSNYRNTNTK